MGNKVKKIFMRRRVPRLPDAYQEVDYIQTSGTQRINTGLYAGNNIQTETKISVETTELNHPIFGGSNGGGSYYHCTPYNNKWYVGINNSESNGGTYSNTIGTIYTIVFNNTNSYLNVDSSDVVSVSGTQGQSGTTLQIAGRYNGSTWYYGIYKYYYFKMYDKTTGKYVRDFVPCYRKSDSVIGMYDLVNNQFYTNAGSGTFTKGTDSSTLELKEFQVWPDEGGTLSGYRDFTTTTKSALEGEGWSGAGGGSWSVSSSGLTTSRSTTDRSYVVSLPITINNQAKSIKIYGVVNRTSGSWYGGFNRGIKATNTCPTDSGYPTGDWLLTQSLSCNTNSGYISQGAGSDTLGFTGPNTGQMNLGYSGSDVTVEAVIDLDGGTCSCSYKSGSTTIWSGNSTFDPATVKAALANVSASQYLAIFHRNGTGNSKYMKNFGYEIIY